MYESPAVNARFSHLGLVRGVSLKYFGRELSLRNVSNMSISEEREIKEMMGLQSAFERRSTELMVVPVIRQRLKTVLFSLSYPNICVISTLSSFSDSGT